MTKQVALFVISTLQGGTPATNFDLMRAVQYQFRTLLLVSDSRKVQLFEFTNRACVVLDSYVLSSSITPRSHVSNEYDRLFSTWISRYEVNLIHVRHLAWHSLNIPSLARQAHIPCVMSLHDYYLICPSVKLLDDRGRYCAGRCSSGGECRQELWPISIMPDLKNKFIHIWQRRSEEVLRSCDALVVTSKFAADLYSKLFPEVSSRLRIIPHGRDFKVRKADLLMLKNGKGKFKVLLANVNSVAKGSELVSQICQLVSGDKFEFHIIGEWNAPFVPEGAFMHGVYSRKHFTEIVDRLSPHIGMLTSIWPETYCHVLTEMWAAGLPVLAVDGGAVGERLRECGGGWLLEHADAHLAVQALEYLCSNQSELSREYAAVDDVQSSILRLSTIDKMASMYIQLYEDLVNASRTRFEYV